MLSSIKIGAILIALFAFYVAPILPLMVITSIPNFIGSSVETRSTFMPFTLLLLFAWAYAIAPIGAGYFAAKLAGHQPLLHSLIVGVIGATLITLWSHSASAAIGTSLAILMALSGLFGGWLWRYRNRQQNAP